MTRAPSYIPNVALPFGALARYGFFIAQSNIVGPSPDFVRPNQPTIPHLYNSQTLSEGRQGIWAPNGAMDGDQTYPQLKYKGTQEQWGLDLKAAGKRPALATFAKTGTSVVEFINGSQTQINMNAFCAQLIAMTGPQAWNIYSIWGEADANQLATSLAFGANFTTLIGNLRTAFFPGARVYLNSLNINYDNGQPEPMKTDWRANVRAGQAAFVAGDVNAQLFNFDGLSYLSPHYLDAGLDAGGSLFASATLIYQP